LRAGRPPIPTKLKAIRGTLRPERRNLREPMLPSRVPVLPRELPRTARPAWRWLVRSLAPMKVLTRSDGQVLLLAACRLSEYLTLHRFITEHGMTYQHTSVTGEASPRQRPEVPAMNAAWRGAMDALMQLGLTPSARSRVSAVASAGDNENELERFLAPARRGV
jgi:P27 family predicted phage terminase small subunit